MKAACPAGHGQERQSSAASRLWHDAHVFTFLARARTLGGVVSSPTGIRGCAVRNQPLICEDVPASGFRRWKRRRCPCLARGRARALPGPLTGSLGRRRP